jgi:phosphatidate cytidylyltransferase
MISPQIISLTFCGLLLIYCLYEFKQATKVSPFLIPIGFLGGIVLYTNINEMPITVSYVVLLLFSIFGFVILFLKNRACAQISPITLIFFIPTGLCFFTLCMISKPGLAITLILLVQFSDIFAYFGGKFFGKYKLFPKISPNKTLEGFLFSLLGVALALTISKLYIGSITQDWLIIAGVLWPLFGLFTNAGDLVFSKIKRSHSLKDFSNILPGHGGILDRIDNLIFCAPLAYIILH